MAKTDTALLPCPFCGAQARAPENVSKPSQRPTWEISCALYCIGMRRLTRARVVEDWNTRAK